MLTFHSGSFWKEITTRVRRTKRRCYAAVAYFGKGASKRLPLRSGDVLVVNMSEAAVKAGQTHPKDILALLTKGVHVFSVSNLHAKVFVLGTRAVVGSTNVSRSSADLLIEAAIQLTDRNLIKQCREFVKSLMAEEVTPHQAKSLQSVYRPPKTNQGLKRRRRQRQPQAIPLHNRLWFVRTERGDWTSDDYRIEQKELPVAKSKLRSTRFYRVDKFLWFGRDRFCRHVKKGDNVIEVEEETPRNMFVISSRKVIHAPRYTRGKSSRVMVFLEARKGSRKRRLKNVLARLGQQGKVLKELANSRLVDPAKSGELMRQLRDAGQP